MEKLTKLNYVDLADKIMEGIVKKSLGKEIITTSKIRNILSMVIEIYNLAMHEKEESISEDLQSKLRYLKMRFIYEAGRGKTNKNKENIVKDFIEKANIVAYLDNIKDSKKKEDVLIFCHYIESLVAFRKYYGQTLNNLDNDI